MRSASIPANTSNNQFPCFYEDNKAAQQGSSYYYNKNNKYQNNSKRKDFNKTHQVSDIVEHSNLHATANEFVPNQNKQSRGASVNTNKNNRSRTSTDYQNQDVEQKSSNSVSEDSRIKYNDRRFENKRDAGRRWREPQNSQYPREDKKDYGRNQNSRKYQNDKYVDNRNFSDKPRNNRSNKNDSKNAAPEPYLNNEKERTVDDDQSISNNSNVLDSLPEADGQSSNAQSMKNSKLPPNNARGDRYDRKDRYNPKDPRDRRSNYPEHNGYTRNNYNRDNYSRDNKYERRENRNMYVDNRDKEMMDWRQRSNDPINKSALLKRSYHKKYQPGKFENNLLQS